MSAAFPLPNFPFAKMGNTNSQAAMEKTLWNMKFTAKQLITESKRCEKKQREEESKCLKAMDSGNAEIARVYAANAIREKNQAINFVRLSSRIEAVAGRVETAIRMNNLTKQIVSVTNGMDSILGSMDVEKIANVMDKFESQFDSLDVRAGHMERSIASSTSTSVPEDEVDDLVARVRQERDLKSKGQMVSAASGSIAGPVGSGVASGPGKVAEAAAVAAPTAPAPPTNLPPAAPTNKPDDKGGSSGGGDGGAGVSSGGGGSDLASRLAALRR